MQEKKHHNFCDRSSSCFYFHFHFYLLIKFSSYDISPIINRIQIHYYRMLNSQCSWKNSHVALLFLSLLLRPHTLAGEKSLHLQNKQSFKTSVIHASSSSSWIVWKKNLKFINSERVQLYIFLSFLTLNHFP